MLDYLHLCIPPQGEKTEKWQKTAPNTDPALTGKPLERSEGSAGGCGFQVVPRPRCVGQLRLEQADWRDEGGGGSHRTFLADGHTEEAVIDGVFGEPAGEMRWRQPPD